MQHRVKQKQKQRPLTISLFVNFVVTDETFNLSNISLKLSIHQLKCRIELETGIPYELQELCYLDAAHLPDEQTIENIDIVPNAIIGLKVWNAWKEVVNASCANDINLLYTIGVTQDSGYQTATSEYMLPKQRRDWLMHRSSVALFIACHRSHFEMVRRLLQSGADINSRTAAGRTPLHVAAARDNCEIVDLLLENGADIDLQDNDESADGVGRTALEVAAQSGHKACERRLFMHRWEQRANATRAAKGAAESQLAAGAAAGQQQLLEFQRSDSSNPRWRVGPQAQVYMEATSASKAGRTHEGVTAAVRDGKEAAAISFEQWQEQKRLERAKQLRLRKQKSDQMQRQAAEVKAISAARVSNGAINDELLNQAVNAAIQPEETQPQQQQQPALQPQPGDATGGGTHQHQHREAAIRRLDPQLNAYEQWLKDRVDAGSSVAVVGSSSSESQHELLPYQLMIEEFCRTKCCSHPHHQ